MEDIDKIRNNLLLDKIKEEFLSEENKVHPRVFKFKNVFTCDDFCWINKLTYNNCVRYYDIETQCMYLKVL